jgi:plasmid stabilization system protein ParE
MKFIWAQYALNDLRDIREHPKANQSPTFVKTVTQEILAEVNSLPIEN